MTQWTDPIETDAYYGAGRPLIFGTRAMASSGHYWATLAAYTTLQQGGNAVDAGVAAGLCLNVVHPDMTSLGGVAPIMIYSADKDAVVTIDGLGTWPRAVSLDVVRQRYHGDLPPGIPRSVVPAAADAWITALDLYGTMSFGQVAAPALQLAEEGFPVYRFLYRNLIEDLAGYRRFPSTAAVLLRHGDVPPLGTLVVQQELAATLRRMIAAEDQSRLASRRAGLAAARAEFYEGETARRMVDFVREQGGLLDATDLAGFRVLLERPVATTYRDQYTLYACGPWCQGPVLPEALNLLEGFDLKALDHDGPDYLHLLVEAMKLAFADREAFFGDPAHIDVPIDGLLSKAYAERRRRAIDPRQATPDLPAAGDPWPYEGRSPDQARRVRQGGGGGQLTWELDTSYVCVVDRWGNAFSATPSDSAASSAIVPGVGCIVSSRGSQSWLDEGHPSALAPGKRPRLTPSPAMVFHRGRPYMIFGTPGGDVQPQAMLQVFLNVVEFGMDLQSALEMERVATRSVPNSFWPHSYLPGLLSLEAGMPRRVADELSRLGHRVHFLTPWERHRLSSVCAILINRDLGLLSGGADNRRESYAAGW